MNIEFYIDTTRQCQTLGETLEDSRRYLFEDYLFLNLCQRGSEANPNTSIPSEDPNFFLELKHEIGKTATVTNYCTLTDLLLQCRKCTYC